MNVSRELEFVASQLLATDTLDSRIYGRRRYIALTDFPKGQEIAKVKTWSDALQFVEQYSDRATEWFKALFHKLESEGYTEEAELIEKAFNAIPAP